MALPRRHLIRGLASLLALLATGVAHSTARAAKPPENPSQFRVLALGNPVPLERICYDFGKQSTPLLPSDISLSPLYARRAEDTSLTFYRQVPPVPPETQPSRLPLTTVGLGATPLSLVVLKATKNQVSSTALDDSWAAFPSGTVRVVSFSKRRIAAEVERTPAEIAPNSFHLFRFSTEKPRIRIKVASQDGETWQMRFNNSQAVLPGCRVNVVLYDQEPTPEDPNPSHLVVIKMVDPLPPPPDSPSR